MNNTCPNCGVGYAVMYAVASRDIGRQLKCKACSTPLTVDKTGVIHDRSRGAAPPRPVGRTGLRIFISYRREDSADASGRICDRLRAGFGEGVFKDVDSMPVGVDFEEFIAEQISACDVVLVVIGPRWTSVASRDGTPRLHDPSDFVRIEVEQALRHQLLVIPTLVGHTEMPRATVLPESIQKLAKRNASQVRPDPDFHRDMDRLIRELEQYQTRLFLSEPPKPSATPPAPPPVPKQPVQAPTYDDDDDLVSEGTDLEGQQTQYHYDAMTTTGAEVKGWVTALNEEDAHRKIKAMGYFVTKLTAWGTQGSEKSTPPASDSDWDFELLADDDDSAIGLS